MSIGAPVIRESVAPAPASDNPASWRGNPRLIKTTVRAYAFAERRDVSKASTFTSLETLMPPSTFHTSPARC